ncbi:MAG: branched-chain amino acid ABC transporter permease [Candidimonas sp.]|nr:MAG: branched-chain amino acid ABC transporter permease [Candidimonas sp.]TAM24152.1 MAG: branched-chain amino acid ABC transporter permease [Candidimonas sp.]TAM76882.1 MAG: branched-chain amino acid ABC transporter permease [Candidimonas sp.]
MKKVKSLYCLAIIFPLMGLALTQVGLAPALSDVIVISAYYLLLAGSWDLLAGFTGQFSFAHVGLAAAGAYGVGWVTLHLGLPVWVSFIVSPLIVGATGFALGLVSCRVRGTQLSLITFAFAGAFGVFLSAASDITGGSMGLQVPRLIHGRSHDIYLLVAGVAVGLFFALQEWMLSGALGLRMQAVRDNEEVAAASGIDVVKVKVLAFTITAAVAGFAGAFYASYVGVLAPTILSINEMGLVLAMVVVGGMGYRLGPLLGVVVIRTTEYFVRGAAAQYTTLVIAAITLLVVLYFRQGLVHALTQVWRRIYAPQGRWGEHPVETVLPPPSASD